MLSITTLHPSQNPRSTFLHGPTTAPADARATPTWATPQLVEIAVGQEINAYACAERT